MSEPQSNEQNIREIATDTRSANDVPYKNSPESRWMGGGYGAPPAGNYQPPPTYGYGTAPPPYNTAPAYGSGQPYGAPGGYSAPGYPGGYGAPMQQPPPPPGVGQEQWNMFRAVDEDGNGRITAGELQKALMNGNWSPFNAETCRIMVGMFDIDRNGTIDVKEFAALWKYVQDWKACFDRFDTDRSGNIDANELHSAFRTFGYNLSMNFTNLCVQVFDRHNKRSMKFDDFIQCCVMLKGLTDKFKEKDTQATGVVRIHYEEFLRMALDNTVV